MKKILNRSDPEDPRNQIGLADAQRWASDLEDSYKADQYELCLIGPCSQSVIQAKQLGMVRIPPPPYAQLKGSWSCTKNGKPLFHDVLQRVSCW